MTRSNPRTIGLLGGLSWESTQIYYRHLNRGFADRLGAPHSARIALWSFDFADLQPLLDRRDWERAGEVVAAGARAVERAGADFLLIGSNTVHRLAEPIRAATSLPLLHIVDATAREIARRGFDRVGLLGTRPTLEETFYVERLAAHGIESLIPAAEDREILHRVIAEELCCGQLVLRSKHEFLRIAEGLARDGAQGIVLGCTEIGLLIADGEAAIPFFDTATLHAEAAIDVALGPWPSPLVA